MLDYPRKIVVLRHAEKPTRQGDQRLSSPGRERAGYLATFIPRNFGAPDYLFAAAPTPKSLRPLLTILPLWERLDGVPVDVSFQSTDEQELARCIVPDDTGMPGRFSGKNVVICWQRGRLPALMTSLGATSGSFPDPWPEDDFSSLYVLARDNDRVITTRYEMLF